MTSCNTRPKPSAATQIEISGCKHIVPTIASCLRPVRAASYQASYHSHRTDRATPRRPHHTAMPRHRHVNTSEVTDIRYYIGMPNRTPMPYHKRTPYVAAVHIDRNTYTTSTGLRYYTGIPYQRTRHQQQMHQSFPTTEYMREIERAPPRKKNCGALHRTAAQKSSCYTPRHC